MTEMKDRSKVIFGNVINPRKAAKAARSKVKFARKYGDDSDKNYIPAISKNAYIGDTLGVSDIRLSEGTAADGEVAQEQFDHEKGIIIGNIRMGFGHYRMSMAIASAANALGYKPYWFDLASFEGTTCSSIINEQNKLYSMGSRISQKSFLFNKYFWEPMNYDGFRKLSYNSADQKNAELMAPVYKMVPKDIPVVGTHAWPVQAANHAGMKYTVNAIPDDWPMGLHLAEGSVHTIQTHNSYFGYRVLNGMDGRKILNPMGHDDLKYTGHYIDHELVSNIEADCEARKRRVENGKPMRFLLSIGGAGAQKEIFQAIIEHLIPQIKAGKATLYVNVGDYRNVWDWLLEQIPELAGIATEHFNNWDDTEAFCNDALTNDDVTGVHAFWHENIFQAVYSTNLLMRSCDVLVTKPSELAFYPVPKLFIKRIGGHEKWGAMHSAEIGDGTIECRHRPNILQMADLFLEDPSVLTDMCDNIVRNKQIGIYDGAYKVVEIAMGLREKDQ